MPAQEPSEVDEAAMVVPPLSPRLRLATLATAAWMVLLGLASTIIGGHDAFSGLGLQARALGVLLLVNGVALLVGTVGLVRRTDNGLALALVGTLMSVVLGILIFLAQAINGEVDPRLVTGGAIVALCAASAACIRAATPPVYRATGIRANIPALKSTLSIGLLVSVGQFWYSQIYVPSTKPPGLTLNTTVEKVGTYKGLDIVHGTVEVKNDSGSRVPVLSSTLNVLGERVAPAAIDAASFERQARQVDLERRPWSDRYLLEKEPHTLSYGHLVPQGTFYDPGETDSVPFATLVPKEEYQGALVRVAVMIGRIDRLRIDDEDGSGSPHGNAVQWRTNLPESGWLEHLTRGKRNLLVTYDEDHQMTYNFDRGPGTEPLAPEVVRRLAHVYGLSYLVSSSETPLP